MSRSWSTLVAEGRKAAKQESDAKWQLGDLALEVAPVGDQGKHSGALEALGKYANEIGVEPDTLREYRRVAEAWPDARRLASEQASWSAHQDLAAHPDRFKLLTRKPPKGDRWTVDAVRRQLGKEPTRHEPPARTAREKAEAVQVYLSDPVVREQVATDDKIGRTVRKASAEATEALTSRVEQRERAPKPTATDRYLDITRHLDSGWSHHREALRRLADVGELPPPLREDALATARDTQETLNVIIEALELGSLTINDQQLEELLREG